MNMEKNILKQSKIFSLIEQCLNVLSGVFVALLLWIFLIQPIYNIDKSFIENIQIVLIFTIVSIIRGYLWRRFFNSIKM